MKKLLVVLLCCSILLLSGCNKKYKRISFESDALSDGSAAYVQENATVVNKATDHFKSQLPIYKIKEQNIPTKEFQQMLQALNLSDGGSSFYSIELEGNSINGTWSDVGTGIFTMSEQELEALAWETFHKIPFLEGEYEYFGIRGEEAVSDSNGRHITSILVSFRRVLDGVPVTGEDQCDLWFDDSGLEGINIRLFDYEKIGMMDLVPLEDAETRIKTPDGCSWDSVENVLAQDVNALQVDHVKLQLINQHWRGCEILQPIYNFVGTAALNGGTQTKFNSKVIAIPESYTYEVTAAKVE